VDAPTSIQAGRSAPARDAPRVAELERELDGARADLDAAHRTIEASGEEQRAVNKEALSVNEEFQSTNEELLTSKEELQSLNEELQALNSQLQETLERQRGTSNDLQNILYSTDVATLFLDRDLSIRFFTPATRALFNVIPGDVGRPLADLHSLATDTLLPADVRAVLHDLQLVEREVETPGGTWFRRRVLPYRTEGPGSSGGIEGVVITFNDITRRSGTWTPRTWPSPASWPRPATTCASRCRPWRCCKGCWRATSRGTRQRTWSRGWTTRWAR